MALLAVVAFAVGIGSATAIFTVVNGVLLRPLPYPSGERFVSVYAARTTQPGVFNGMSVPELHDYQQQTTSFDVFGWFRTGLYRLTAPGEPQFVQGAAVTPALAQQLGPPLLGRWFADDSNAVISSALWRRLGGGRDIIGSAITLDERRYTVSGVMPPAFHMPLAGTSMSRGDTEVWIPLESVAARREPEQQPVLHVRAPQAGGVAGTGTGGRQARRRHHRRDRPEALSVLHGGRRRAARTDIQRPSRHAPDPARRRGTPPAYRLRQRRHAAAGASRRPRPRYGHPRRARRVASPARAALLRRRRARLRCRRRCRRRSERRLRPPDPRRGVGLRPAHGGDCHRLEGPRLQRGDRRRHGSDRRPGPTLAGDAHGAERGAH